jgi:hypothetical protein
MNFSQRPPHAHTSHLPVPPQTPSSSSLWSLLLWYKICISGAAGVFLARVIYSREGDFAAAAGRRSFIFWCARAVCKILAFLIEVGRAHGRLPYHRAQISFLHMAPSNLSSVCVCVTAAGVVLVAWEWGGGGGGRDIYLGERVCIYMVKPQQQHKTTT